MVMLVTLVHVVSREIKQGQIEEYAAILRILAIYDMRHEKKGKKMFPKVRPLDHRCMRITGY